MLIQLELNPIILLRRWPTMSDKKIIHEGFQPNGDGTHNFSFQPTNQHNGQPVQGNSHIPKPSNMKPSAQKPPENKN